MLLLSTLVELTWNRWMVIRSNYNYWEPNYPGFETPELILNTPLNVVGLEDSIIIVFSKPQFKNLQ